VRVIRHDKNYGYGAALKTGIKASGNGHILIVDGDGSYPVDDIPELLRDCDKYDMVIGARTKTGAAMSLMRSIAKSFLGKLAQYLVKERIPDINSGLRVFTRSMYEKYRRILPDGFSFTITITLASMSGRENIRFIPIGYHKRRGISKIRPIHDTVGFFLLIIRTILLFNPLRVFMPVAALFFIAAAALAVYSISVLGRFMDVSVTLLCVFGAQIIILGFMADLINRRAD
jgi:glycosyltransferase involved in cell wall biosynthesis